MDRTEMARMAYHLAPGRYGWSVTLLSLSGEVTVLCRGEAATYAEAARLAGIPRAP